MSQDLRGALDALKTRFRPGSVDRELVYYLSLGDAPDEKWTVKLGPKSCELAPGKPENADCVLKTSAALFAGLVDGSWQPGLTDFVSGKIKTSNLDLLQKLQLAFGL
jgi:long-chain acyl-CoA synthetase